MKKIILLLFLLCCFKKVNAVYFYYGDELVPNMYMVRNSGSAAESSAVYLVKRVDTKEFAYCIEPLTLLNRDSNYIEYNYNANNFNLTDEIINKINLIAYYGYKYPTHDDISWYGVTQYLIWKTIYPNYAFFFADGYFGNRVFNYDNMVNELEYLVQKDLEGFELKDSYNLKTGTDYVLLHDDLLLNYEVIDNDIARIDNNKLIVKSNVAGDYKITLRHKNWRFNHYFLYDSIDAQDLFISGHVDNQIILNVSFKDSLLRIYKKDYDNDFNHLTTSGAIYNLYNSNNELISTKEVIDGYMDFKVPIGTYYLEEVKPSYGYLINGKEQINVNDDTEYTTYEHKIYKKIKIHKRYNDKKELFDEEDAHFDLYLNDNKIKELITDKNGIIELNLPYGNYKLVQTKGIDNYYLAKDIEFIIDDDYKEDTIEIINYKKEVLGSKIIILKYEVPDTKLDDTNIYYPFIKLIIFFIYVYKKVYF